MLKKHLKKIVSLVLVTMMAIGMSITCTNRNSKKILQKRPCQHTYATTDNKSC